MASASDGASGNSIQSGNVIAYNAGAGVFITTGIGNVIRLNSIHHNAGIAIDLAPAGITPNDLTDDDFGPNQLQNYPIITSAASSGASVTVSAWLRSKPSTSYTVDFYGNSSSGQWGERSLYTTSVTTDSAGYVEFTNTFASLGFMNFTATATDGAGNTSEFSTLGSGSGSGSGSSSVSGPSTGRSRTAFMFATWVFLGF